MIDTKFEEEESSKIPSGSKSLLMANFMALGSGLNSNPTHTKEYYLPQTQRDKKIKARRKANKAAKEARKKNRKCN